jgi:DNA-binding CsgD family transcriptional regulator
MAFGSTLAVDEVRAEKCVEPRANRVPDPSRKLSPRLKQLADILVRGYSLKRCATEMGIAVSSVKVMSSRIYLELGVSGRDELQFYCMSSDFSVWVEKYGRSISENALEELTKIFNRGAQPADRWLD